MSKLGKYEEMRYAGARWAFDLIKEKGLEEAMKEFEWRGIQKAPLCIEKAEILRFENELRENCKRTMAAMACLCLHDQFDFGHNRLVRFIEKWNTEVDCLGMDLMNWPDIAQVLKDETNIDIDLPIDYIKTGGKKA